MPEKPAPSESSKLPAPAGSGCLGLWVVASLAVYGILWCTGVEAPLRAKVADGIITGLLALLAFAAARTPETGQKSRPPDGA